MELYDVKAATPLSGHRLALTFENGVQGVVDVGALLKSYNGIFSPLQDDQYFNQVQVDPELGTVVWPNGADLCPSVLYQVAVSA